MDKRSKKDVWFSASRKWKSFKSTLTTKYVLKYKDRCRLIKKKPEEYEFITQPQWEVFVRSRLTLEFLVSIYLGFSMSFMKLYIT